MKCFYHMDMDGKCAGAIVKSWWDVRHPIEKDKAEYIGINYRDEFPFDTIQKDEDIIIVDFSLQKDGEFERLQEITKNITWIDHHKSAIEKHKDFKCRGIRRDGISGCELAWEYYYPGAVVPRIVKMLGSYDIWDFSEFGEALNKLQAGIKLQDTRPESPNWRQWLDATRQDALPGNTGHMPDGLGGLLADGGVALKYRNKVWASQIKAWSFFAEFEGHRVIACNAGSVSSQMFDSVKGDYDLMMPFVWDGEQWTVSIYTKKDDIDCSKLAGLYGGGGHAKASGFQCKELPFKFISRG